MKGQKLLRDCLNFVREEIKIMSVGVLNNVVT